MYSNLQYFLKDIWKYSNNKNSFEFWCDGAHELQLFMWMSGKEEVWIEEERGVIALLHGDLIWVHLVQKLILLKKLISVSHQSSNHVSDEIASHQLFISLICFFSESRTLFWLDWIAIWSTLKHLYNKMYKNSIICS